MRGKFASAIRLVNADVALPAALFATVFVYLRFLSPRALVALDEGAFLYEAKRVLDGQVMYRDFFDVTGPAANYAMAFMDALFGVSIETARGTMGILLGGIAVLMYSIARHLGVRPILAATVCVTLIALFYPALPFSSPHWFSTGFTVLIFWFVLRRPVTRSRDAVVAGAMTGLVALTQQPKAGATAAAVAIVLMRDAWTARALHPFATSLGRQLGAYAGGVLAIVAPTLGAFVATAGFHPVFDALVVIPLGPYRNFVYVKEGRWLPFTMDAALLRQLIVSVSPILLLDIMPFIIPISAARLLWQAAAGVRAEQRRPLFVAVVFSAFAIVSVLYQPNNSHFAVVGPIWLSLFAESLERLVQRVERRVRKPLGAALATTGVLTLLLLEVHRSLATQWAATGVAADTPFGRMHFHHESAVDELEAVRGALDAANAKQILVYPYGASVYLMTETSNPTRFQMLIPGYNTAEQFAEVQQILERQRVPFVIRTLWWWGPDGDPLMPYLKEHYEGVRLQRKYRSFPLLPLWRRKADE